MDIIVALQRMGGKAYCDARKAHDYIFSDSPTKQQISVAYLNKAIAEISAAQALYYARYEELEHNDIEDVFHALDTFANEMLNNIATEHSHQWTDIEFNQLKSKFERSVLNLPVV